MTAVEFIASAGDLEHYIQSDVAESRGKAREEREM
jgi:hypothetical protein